MKTPLILNESKSLDTMGSIEIYRDLDSLLLDVEPIDVKNEEYFCFDADGRKVSLFVGADAKGLEYVIARAEGHPTQKEILKKLIESYLLWLVDDGRFGISEIKVKTAQGLSDLVELIPQRLYCKY